MRKYFLYLFIVLSLFTNTYAAITDLTVHGWDFVNDTGVCGINDVGSTTDDIMLTVQDGVDNMQFRVKWCIKGDLDGYTDAQLIYSETLDTLDTWTNASPPYYYGVMNQGGNLSPTSEFRFWDSPWINHQDPISCIQTDDHNPEIGYVFENNYGPLEFNNSPSSNSKCIEYELTFEYLGNKSTTYQFAMLLNGTFIPESAMHGKQGIMIQTVASNSTDTDPPAAISNLQNISVGTNYAYWNWTNPTDPDFAYVAITINGESRGITTDNFFNETEDALPNTNLTISITTFDNDGNENLTPRNNTILTLPAPPINETTNVIDVSISEGVSQTVKYNPLGTTAGTWADTGENQSTYVILGTILIENNNANEAVKDVVLNFSSIGNIYDLAFDSGTSGFVSEFNTGLDYAVIVVPDLGAGQNSTFTYSINTTIIAPLLNFTSSFSSHNVFSGLDVDITDNLENIMNSSEYTGTCVYNISIIQNALQVVQVPTNLNFTFSPASLSGSDASNATIAGDSRSLTWNTWNSQCFETSNQTDISYAINAPLGVVENKDYEFINTTISYAYNGTISQLQLSSLTGVTDLELNFEKYQVNVLDGDNATWKITSEVFSLSNITVNLTSVTLWVSKRNGTGTGFTNPSLIDNDTISGASLNTAYSPNVLLNSSLAPWNNLGFEWFFNYTYSSSPIVWMDLENRIFNDGKQLINSSITSDGNETYIKEIYVTTGYWIEITKNITRISEANYNVLIEVGNLGSTPTPNNQVVVVYNFLPNEFNLLTPFIYSVSTWYTTDETNTTLNDVNYNGTMFQYALTPNGNPSNSSLDLYGGAPNANNTWSVTYNISGSGEFALDDLFLTGVDPLNVGEVGGTRSIDTESKYKILSASLEYLLVGIASFIGILIILI